MVTSIKTERTGKDGYDCLMDGRDLFLLKHIARKEGYYEQHNGNEESPCREELLLRGVALYNSISCQPVIPNRPSRLNRPVWTPRVPSRSYEPSGSDSSSSRPK